MTLPLCLDHLSLVDLTALELAEVAAKLGFARVSLFITPLPLSPALDLTTNPPALLALRRAMAADGLKAGVIEPFMLDTATDWELLQRSADVAAELGGCVNALGFDPEPARLEDSLARLAAMARKAGTAMVIEAYPLSQIRTQAEALAYAAALGPDIGLCVDVLHVIRSGGTWDDVAALPQDRIRHVQLNDGPLQPPQDRFHEAVAGRLPPGAGEFDLRALLPRLPAGAVLAVEAPFQAPTGLTPLSRGRILVDATREMLRGAS
jgi:sugar phosphate isomerase/epimerase